MTHAIVVCCDHRMIPAACCTLLSAAQAATVRPRLFLVIQGPANHAEAAQFSARHGLGIEILRHAGTHADSDLAQSRFSVATMTRLYLDRLLPPDLERVLYLDSDMLVFDDVAPLLACDLGGHPLGAVDDLAHKRNRYAALRDDRKVKIGMRPQAAYFNAGVLLFDWPRICREGTLGRSVSLYRQDPGRYEFYDQDALNAVVDGNFQPLPVRWNRQPRQRLLGSGSGIVHFVGSVKPWHADVTSRYWPYRTNYRRLLAGSGWESFIKPLDAAARFRVALGFPGYLAAWAARRLTTRAGEDLAQA